MHYMSSTSPLRSRLLSLDVFRGITIAGMILVNSPGNDTAYAQLDHSAWNGCTFTDLIFPLNWLRALSMAASGRSKSIDSHQLVRARRSMAQTGTEWPGTSNRRTVSKP